MSTLTVPGFGSGAAEAAETRAGRAAAGGLVPDQAVIAGDQRLFIAPQMTAPPATATSEPDAPWFDLGYTTEDGLALSFGKETDTLVASQSLDPIRMMVTAAPKTITAALLQLNSETLALALGGGEFTGVDSAWQFEPAPSSFIDIRALLVVAVDGDATFGFWFARTMISEAVDFSFVNTAGVSLPLTFSVLAASPSFRVAGGGSDGFMIGDGDGSSGNVALAVEPGATGMDAAATVTPTA